MSQLTSSILLFFILLGQFFSLLYGQTLFANETYNGGSNDDFHFTITITDTTTTCIMKGPTSSYLGVGFGSRTMPGTYAVVYANEGGSVSLFEQILAEDAEGSTVTPCNAGTESCVSLLSANDDGTFLTVKWERDNDPSNTDSTNLYVFDNTVTEFEMIWAFGTSLNFGTHRPTERGSTDVDFSTSSTNTDPGASEYEITQEITDLGMTIYMRITEDEMEFILTGPSDRWFGIAWNGHTSGDALLYTTDGDTVYAYDGKLRDQVETGSTNNGIDDSQDWIISEITESGDGETVTIHATRALDTGDSEDVSFDFPPSTQEYYFAIGATSNSYDLEYHGSNYVRLDVNLKSGIVTVVADTEFTTEQHALFMFLAFGIFLPWSALINRFLGFSICSKISFFRSFGYLSIELHKVMMIIGWVFCMIGFITKWADSSSILFDSLHDTLGFLGVIMITVITFGSIMGSKQNKIVGRYKGIGDLQATNGHRIFGIIFIIYGLFVLLTGLSLYYGIDSVKFMLYIVYLLILIVFWLIFEFYGCTNKDSMNKAFVNNNENNEKLPIVFDEIGGTTKSNLIAATSQDEITNATNPNNPTNSNVDINDTQEINS